MTRRATKEWLFGVPVSQWPGRGILTRNIAPLKLNHITYVPTSPPSKLVAFFRRREKQRVALRKAQRKRWGAQRTQATYGTESGNLTNAVLKQGGHKCRGVANKFVPLLLRPETYNCKRCLTLVHFECIRSRSNFWYSMRSLKKREKHDEKDEGGSKQHFLQGTGTGIEKNKKKKRN